jgi:hypothetical protein
LKDEILEEILIKKIPKAKKTSTKGMRIKIERKQPTEDEI